MGEHAGAELHQGQQEYSMENVGNAAGPAAPHELVHALTRSGWHGREGVQRPALSGRELISGSLPLGPDEVARLRELQKSRWSRELGGLGQTAG